MVGITNSSDYSPFGVQLDGRTASNDQYRYGFQNQEVDDEIKGEGNSVNYKYRMHDPRVGRFFAVDPLSPEYPWNSPYAFSENVVINAVELEGLEKIDHYVYSPTKKEWVLSWQEIDNNLTENLNAYHYFDKDKKNYKTVVKPWEKNKDGVRLRVTFNGNIKKNPEDRENRQALYHLFSSTEFAKKSEADKELEAKVNNSVSKDATYYGAFEGNYDGADGGGQYAGLKNMPKAADGLDRISENLQLSPHPVTQAGGLALSFGAEVLRTIYDFNTLDSKSAFYNTIIRSSAFIFKETTNYNLDKIKMGIVEKYIVKEFVDNNVDSSKEGSIIKP